MVRTSTTSTVSRILDLRDEGRDREAWELLESHPPGPERLLAEGVLLAADSPAKARDMLSEALRGVTDGLVERGKVALACCYWNTGEKAEAKITLDSFRPKSDSALFGWALLRSIVEGDNIPSATRWLKGAERMVENVPALRRGKFLQQRGYLYKRANKIDQALIDYTEAKYWYEQADRNPQQLAVISNNIANLRLELKQYNEAHEAADVAIRDLVGFEKAQAYDTKALIYLAEENVAEAAKCVDRSLSLLESDEHRHLLAETLITRAKVRAASGDAIPAFGDLAAAREIGDYLSNQELLLRVTQGSRDVAERLARCAEISAIELALEMERGALRAAALRLNISHPSLLRAISDYGIERKWQKPRPLFQKISK